jgi:hypothetical protein
MNGKPLHDFRASGNIIKLRQLASALGGEIVGGEVLCPGPGHSARDRSLAVRLDKDAPAGFLIHSFSGDDPIECRDHVRQKLGLPKFGGNGGGKQWTLLGEYLYRDEAGAPYLLVRKYRDRSGRKQYPQYHRDGEAWGKGKPKGAKVPYRLPELIAAPATATVYFCEGEKDADTLINLGFVATTTSEGAKAPWSPEMTKWFAGRHVVVLPDADPPGRAHGRKVARALNGVAGSLKVVDLFPDRSDGKDVSDYLEMDRVGAKFVKLCKEAPAWDPSADDGKDGGHSDSCTDDETLIAELAALSKLEYAKRKKAAAKQIGITVGELNKIVAEAVGSTESKEPGPALYPHWNVEPTDEPVDGGILLRAITEAIRRYVFMPEDQAVAVALWIVFSWLHQHEAFATHSPILFATSAEKDSGKTTLLKVISFLVRCGLPNVSISGPALFRSITKWAPCLIIDEADTALVDNEDLRAVINSGWTRGDGVIRCDPDSHEPRLYPTFAPKAIGMKGRKLPDTTLSRSIIITMKPRRPDDPTEWTEDFNHLDNETFARLRAQILRWAIDNAVALAKVEPEIPPGFYNRRRANWKPLLAIAERAGGGWKKAAWKAALAIEAVHDTFEPSIGVQLLIAIRDMFETQSTDRVRSKSLVAVLIEDQTGPWVAFGKSQKPISENGVARLLKKYGIRPRTVRFTDGDTDKGYQLAWFEDVFERHLSPTAAKTPTATVTPSQVSHLNDLGQKQTVTPDLFVTDRNEPSALKMNTCDGVTVVGAVFGGPAADHRCDYCGRLGASSPWDWPGRPDGIWLHSHCEEAWYDSERDRLAITADKWVSQ